MLTCRLLLFAILAGSAPAQKSKPSPEPERTVTVTGCIQPGVECHVLKDKDGKQDYSVTRGHNLKVGRAYRITGSVQMIGFCMQGKPILNPKRITEVALRCDPPK
jgi:hypothetical protein